MLEIIHVIKQTRKWTYNWCDFWIGGCVLEVNRFDARNPLSVVDNFRPGLDQRVKHDVPKEVYNAYSSKSVSFLCQDSFAVKRENLCLSG